MKKGDTNKAMIVLIFLILALIIFIILWKIINNIVEKGFA